MATGDFMSLPLCGLVRNHACMLRRSYTDNHPYTSMQFERDWVAHYTAHDEEIVTDKGKIVKLTQTKPGLSLF